MAFDKTWIILIAGCGVLGLAIWGGMNAMTLKMILLWMFISFGFLTLIMHLFGSPLSVLLGKVFRSTSADEKNKQARYSDAELVQKRQRVLQMKQFLQDNKVEIYKENVSAPREEILSAKREAEFYKFNSTWRGKGQRLRENGEREVEHNFSSEDLLMQDETSSEEETDRMGSQSNNDTKTVNYSETVNDTDAASRQELDMTESLRQRKNKHFCELPEEPDIKEKLVITVALRCPDGTVKKRRFLLQSQLKMLLAFADWLGYSSSRHVILTTYPRQQLSDFSQTFSEAGLTHDTALVLEEM